jgi:hypothetical protein
LSRIRRQFGSKDRGRRLGIIEGCEGLAMVILEHAGAVTDIKKIVPQFRFAPRFVLPTTKDRGRSFPPARRSDPFAQSVKAPKASKMVGRDGRKTEGATLPVRLHSQPKAVTGGVTTPVTAVRMICATAP